MLRDFKHMKSLGYYFSFVGCIAFVIKSSNSGLQSSSGVVYSAPSVFAVRILLIVGQIESVSHKNLSLDGTSSKFGIHVLQGPFSQKSMLPRLTNKMAAIFQDGHLIE